MSASHRLQPQRSIRRHRIVGVGVGGAAGRRHRRLGRRPPSLPARVIAPGTLVVDSQRQEGAAPDRRRRRRAAGARRRPGQGRRRGGAARRDRDRAPTSASSPSSSTSSMRAQARLEAERDGARESTSRDLIGARRDEPDVAGVIEGERKLFELRRTARDGPEGAAARAHRPAAGRDRRACRRRATPRRRRSS